MPDSVLPIYSCDVRSTVRPCAPPRFRVCMANSQFLSISWTSLACCDCAMRDLAAVVLHLLATVARLAGPGGVRAVVAESVLVKQL